MTQNTLPTRIHDDQNGLDYVLNGDYYFPVFDHPYDSLSFGKWGYMHKRYLEKNKPILYNQLLVQGKLNCYLASLNQQAQERLDVIVQQMMKKEGITEQLKAENQMQWVRKMNNIRQRAEESITAELIYV